MEEETLTTSEVPVKAVTEKLETIPDPVQENGKKEEKENSSDDGEFIKVERDASLDVKESARSVEVTSAEEGKPSVSESSRELLEAQEKIKELETELGQVAIALKDSESHNAKLKDEVSLVEEKLEGSGKRYAELEQNHNKLQEQMVEAEHNFNEKLKALQDALDDHATKHKELAGIKESFDGLSLESESSKKKIQELEQELQSRAAEYEGLMKSSHLKIEDAEKKINELESFLEEKKQRIEDLEEQINTLESKYVDAEAESKKYSGMVSELTAEFEKFRSSMLSLESALQTANEKEMALMESLNAMSEEKKISEEALDNSNKKLLEAESLLDALRNELSLTQGKLEGIENDLRTSGLRESEIIEKLKSAENMLEQQAQAIEEATTRKTELETLHESSTRDFDLKMQEVTANFSTKESEAKSLSEKLKILDDKVQSYEQQLAEESQKVASLTEELRESAAKVASLESANDELKKLMAEAESKVTQSLSDHGLLVETNSHLKNKVDELQELLNSANAEKETTALQIASHMNTITELTDQHSRSFELHSSTEARLSQAEEQLKETIANLTEKETEVKELGEQLNSLESQAKSYEEEAREASRIAESRKVEIEQLQETVAKLADKEVEVKELNDRLVALEGQVTTYKGEAHEAARIAESTRVEIQEMVDKLSLKEIEVKELNERLATLEGQVKVHEEEVRQASGVAESREAEIGEMITKLGQKEFEVKELNDKLIALEGHLMTHQEAAREASGIAESRKAEIEKLQETVHQLAQKELEVKELNEALTALECQLKTHQEEAREACGIAETRKLEIEQLQGTVEILAQRELEVKELNERINALESQLNIHQGEAREASGVAESKKLELKELGLKLQDQAKMVEELQLTLGQIETRNEALAEANMKLTQDLALAETEQSDLQGKLSHALVEKDDVAAQFQLSKKAIEDLTQELTSEKQRLQTEISAVLEESSQLSKAKKELQAVVIQLEEQLKEYRGNEDTFRSELENLKVQLNEKSALQERLKELEEHNQAIRAQLKEEVEKLQTTATTREADLTLQLEQHVQKLHDRDSLNEKVLRLDQELQLAQAAVTKLSEENSAKVSELEAARSQTFEELEAKNKEVVLLGKRIEELEQKLQTAEAASKQKGEESNAGAKAVETEVTSRDIGSMLSSPVKRKSKKSDISSAQPSSSVVTQTTAVEASSSMNFKFILGVALVSIIVGVILGKRY